MSAKFLTSNSLDLKSNKDYQKIVFALSRMSRSGIINLGSGYCVSMADMVKTTLEHCGISARVVETQLTISYINATTGNIENTNYIGFSDIVNPGEIDTHVVVITETEIPFLVDASIQHRLTSGYTAVIEPIERSINNPLTLVEKKFNSTLALTYQQKKLQSVAMQYNESIINRIDTDKKIFSNLKLLKILIGIALIIGAFNAMRGTYDFYQVYFNNDNNRGISGLENIIQRLDYIENEIKKIE
jgi:hypothetical protein